MGETPAKSKPGTTFSVVPRTKQKPLKRRGRPTEAEKALIAKVVADQPAEMTSTQVTALARTLRRTKDTVKSMIIQAKEDFQAKADFYVKAHEQAVGAALANGDAKSLAVALEGSQWALENLSIDGVRVIDKQTENSGGGGKVLIGIKIGGMREDQPVTVDAAKVE